ncbi:MAG: aminotransferase class I/II-fold pyridoxal phosphate-dependent enzyme, partial [Leptospiraceae bacterium]|nr:aminotransferase class I/II-fold pyridoxal phosphate-dependent enzyme [Leptospiraceae bacterium]
MKIPFSRAPFFEEVYHTLKEIFDTGKLSGDHKYSLLCHKWFEENLPCKKALTTPSGTAALELSAIGIDLQPEEEVIMPSFTFTSTANAFLLRRAKIVFVDIRPDTLNINEAKIEEAITQKTKAIAVVHYAGVPCEMDTILEIAKKHNLYVIEDAAHSIRSTYKGKETGTLGDFGCFSFHDTKNLSCGEGGALIINKVEYEKKMEIIREKGTNRSQFFRGEVDKYT